MNEEQVVQIFNLTKGEQRVAKKHIKFESVIVDRLYGQEFPGSISTHCLLADLKGVFCRGSTYKSKTDVHCKLVSRRTAFLRAVQAAVDKHRFMVYDAKLNDVEWKMIERRGEAMLTKSIESSDKRIKTKIAAKKSPVKKTVKKS